MYISTLPSSTKASVKHGRLGYLSVNMYVTRPLSLYKKLPEALWEPPEGPGSGFLVIQDSETQNVCCFGQCEDDQVYGLPFPQNKNLIVDDTENEEDIKVIMVPVLGLPLSSNRYYVIGRHGKHKGKAQTSSKEQDMETCLCFRYVPPAKPSPLDPHDIYQQFTIYPKEVGLCGYGGFSAKSVSPGGHPPRFLKSKGWTLRATAPKTYYLDEDARGVNHSLRAQLPNFDFPVDRKSSDAVCVGTWYCPFMFIRDGDVGDQIKNSAYYKMQLEQRWEQIYACVSYQSGGKRVGVDVYIQKEAISVSGQEAVEVKTSGAAERVRWFRRLNDRGGEGGCRGVIGLSDAIVDRMKWEQARVGWVSGGEEEKMARVKRVEEIDDTITGGIWRRFACYVLVERFSLKRMDGTTVLTYDFKHTHQLRSKWE